MERLLINKMILDYEILVLEEKKRVGGLENKDNLGWMKRTPLRKLRLNLANVEIERIHLKRDATVEKDCHDNLDDQEGLVFTWGHENTI